MLTEQNGLVYFGPQVPFEFRTLDLIKQYHKIESIKGLMIGVNTRKAFDNYMQRQYVACIVIIK